MQVGNPDGLYQTEARPRSLTNSSLELDYAFLKKIVLNGYCKSRDNFQPIIVLYFSLAQHSYAKIYLQYRVQLQNIKCCDIRQFYSGLFQNYLANEIQKDKTLPRQANVVYCNVQFTRRPLIIELKFGFTEAVRLKKLFSTQLEDISNLDVSRQSHE